MSEQQIIAWKCDVCGYIHEGPEPPEQCPVCGVEKELFSPIYEEPAEDEESAPPETPPAKGSEQTTWRCLVCGYIHEGPEPPEECPVCGVDASMFEKLEPATAEKVETNGPRIVVVGGGIAALSAVESARNQAPSARITLVASEERLPYYRINLTRVLAGEMTLDRLELRPAQWFDEQRIELVRDSVASVDPKGHRLVTKGGTELEYDKLVLANGAHPFVPPFPGANKKNVFTVRTAGDVERILEATSSPDTQCVCIGGGLLGLEAAAALSRRCHVTVLEGFGWLLPRQLAEPAGKMLEDALSSDTLKVRTGVKIDAIVGDEEVAGVKLDSGEELAAQVVLIATGVRPNTHLARRAGLEVRRGVVVDDGMLTSDPDIYAAGDVAEHGGEVPGLWPVAMEQGHVAGTNAAGGQVRYHGMAPANQLKVVDLELVSIGDPHAKDGSYTVFERREDDTYTRVVCRDGFVVGANLVGDSSLAAELREAIEKRVPLLDLRDLTSKLDGFRTRCVGEG